MKNSRGFIVDKRADLIDEWHPTENMENTPKNVRSGSDKIIIWCCKECNFIWESQAKSRAFRNTGYPKCHERYHAVFPELAIYFYIKQIFNDTQLNFPIEGIGKYRLVDVYVLSLNLIIEYE